MEGETRPKVAIRPGVEKQIVAAAPADAKKPGPGALVSVHYEMRIASGERSGQVIESTRSANKPHLFKLGAGHVIEGLDQGVSSMCKGERSVLYVAPALGYANIGCLPRIPPNVSLCIDVELVGFEAVDVRLPVAFAERMAAATKEKELGNELIKNSKPEEACEHYVRGVRHLQAKGEVSAVERKEIDAAMAVLYLNLATCKLRTQDLTKAETYASKSCQLVRSAKALYRRGQALLAMKQYDAAREVAIDALKLEPNDKNVQELLRSAIAGAKTTESQAGARLWGGMFK